MPSLAELRKQKLEEKNLFQEEKESIQVKKILKKKTEAVKTAAATSLRKNAYIPDGYILVKIPESLEDISMAKLRSMYTDIFGREPPHDSTHGKVWIRNKIIKLLAKGDK